MQPFLAGMLLFLSLTLFSQDFSYPLITKKGQKVKGFIPAGWIILDRASGDLNNV